jgi:hypothetical protein
MDRGGGDGARGGGSAGDEVSGDFGNDFGDDPGETALYISGETRPFDILDTIDDTTEMNSPS